MEWLTKEIVICLVSAIVGGLITFLFTLAIERRKEKREDKKEQLKENKEIYQNRPEMKIVDYKNHFETVGEGIKQKCDIDVFVVPIDDVTVSGEKRHEIVDAHYDMNLFNEDKWCCVIYSFENVGKTNISNIDLTCHYKKDTCLFAHDNAIDMAEKKCLNYSYCYDRKIRVGERVTVKICYHNTKVVSGMFSAIMSIGMVDDNGHYWRQALFAPEDKVYDSRPVDPKTYLSDIRTKDAEECFIHPYLW